MEFDNRRSVRLNRNVDVYILKTIGEHKILPLKNIVAAFFGSGRTTALEEHSIYIDMDESKYQWTEDENGNKVVNPEWPTNYIDDVLKSATDDSDPEHRYVLVPASKDVIAELDNRHIVYSALIPRTKDAAIERNMHKGEDFIKQLSDNYDDYIDTVCKSKVHAIYVSDSYLDKVFP